MTKLTLFIIFTLVSWVFAQSSTNSTTTTFEVYVGFLTEETNYFSFLKFFPDTLYVKVGDKVNFTSYGGEHTVTFNPTSTDLFNGTVHNDTFYQFSNLLMPFGDTNLTSPDQVASSGVLETNDTYQITFSTEGTYNYVCMLHFPIMQGRVIVLPANSNNSSNSTSNDDSSEFYLTPEEEEYKVMDEMDLLVNKTVAALSTVKSVEVDDPPSRTSAALGATVYTVRMEGDWFSKASYHKFIPQEFSIAVGDIVEFVNDDIIVHTVSFNSSGIFEEEMTFDADLDVFLFNSIYFKPSGGDPDSYDGGFVSSGFLYPLAVPESASTNGTVTRSFSVRFTAPGSYPFRCDLHYEAGMVGVITVVAPPAPSTSAPAPSTSAAAPETSASGSGSSESGSTTI